jgi:hypothetical protein
MPAVSASPWSEKKISVIFSRSGSDDTCEDAADMDAIRRGRQAARRGRADRKLAPS